MNSRLVIQLVLLIAIAAGMLAILRQGQLPPADFTFNNETEIESLDPAVVTGQPEGRIIDALYEGLVRLGPKNREPLPGMAESWDLSDDGLTYTFKLREDARWSNGEPFTTDDVLYSMRRFLDPQTLAEYAYAAWYIKNSRRYSRAARAVEIGDPVEVELHEKVAGALPFARSQVVRGKLVDVAVDDASAEELEDPENYTRLRTFVVELNDGTTKRYRIAGPEATFDNAVVCKQLLLDFSEVGIRAVDERTIEMTLENPTPYWLQLLGFYPLAPVNKTCVETHGSPQWTYAENIVTNGPYNLVFRRIRDRIRLKKNPYYWDRENVALETIDALAVQSLTTAFNLYSTSELDWTTKVPALIAQELLKQDPPRNDFNPANQFGTYYYMINVTRPPFDNAKVRQALALALDRKQILATACSVEKAAYSFTPTGLPGYEPPQCPELDVEKARKLLAEAGYANGVGFPKIEILYNTEEQHQTIAELVRKQWRRNLGINVSTRNEEWGACLASQRQLRYDVCRKAWIGDYLDPYTFLDLMVTGGENNNTGWGDPEYDKLIVAAREESDPAERLAMLRKAEGMLMEQLPIIPIYYYGTRNLVKPHVRGFYNNLQDTHPLWAISVDHEATEPNEYMAPPPDE